MKHLYYDIECYPDYFCVCMLFVESETGTSRRAVARINDHDRVKKIFSLNDVEFVGYNSAGYDDVMLAYWMSLGKSCRQSDLKDMNDTLIHGNEEWQRDPACAAWLKENYSEITYSKFGEKRVMRFVRTDSEAAGYLNHPRRKICDLYLLGEKQGGLKNAEIILGMECLEETPFSFDEPVGNRTALVDKYCFNDVEATRVCHEWYREQIEVRRQFEAEGIHNATALGSAKLAERYICMMHEAKTGKRITRDDIPDYKTRELVSEITKGYDYEFTTPEYKAFWNMLKVAHINFEPHQYVDTWHPDDDEDDGVIEKKDLAKPSIYSIGRQAISKGRMIVNGNGLKLKFGGGGLHNDARSGLFRKGKGKSIFDIDVTSYYPSLMIKNKFAPRHMKEFPQHLEDLFAQRVAAKKAKRTKESDAKKLVLNAAFGKTKDRHSLIYDPKAHYSVTVNGQLLLLTLIDMLYEYVPGVEVLNVNTDGLCVYLDDEHIPMMRRVMKAWEDFSMCALEEKEYEIFAQSTCNLYCGRYIDGTVKTKGGDFKVKPTSLKETFAKSVIVKKAVVNYLLDGLCLEETIAKGDVSEFIMSFQYGKKTFATFDGVKQPGRKALRYVYGKEGVKLGRVSLSQVEQDKTGSLVDGGLPVVVADRLSTIDRSMIDESRYVSQAQLIVLGMLRKPEKGTGADVRRNPGKYWPMMDWRDQ